jgi:hypothetical protein
MSTTPYNINAVSVNHNTSSYMELMLRLLFACHPKEMHLSLTVFDNQSTDDTSELFAYAARANVPIMQSGWSLQTHGNSHGNILRRFVLNHPDCSHYLFLDADVVFIQPNTIQTMIDELERAPDAFGIGSCMSWDGVNDIPAVIREENPDICDARLHPCCALVRNIPLSRRVVEILGLSCVTYHWADRDEYLDTFKLMTKVMQTHGLKHTFSSALIQHFFCTSYAWDTEEIRQRKAEMRDQRLNDLRAVERQFNNDTALG